jgi:hypothetical protein
MRKFEHKLKLTLNPSLSHRDGNAKKERDFENSVESPLLFAREGVGG